MLVHKNLNAALHQTTRGFRVGLQRVGTADEVASLVLFLLSDESGYITVAEVAIDGGVSL